jgi:acyl-CoA synthetase (AMP-forming)/AMP-acid ligase II
MEVPEVDCRPTVADRIRLSAEMFGDADFIVMPDRRMSFRQAEVASRRFAKQLLARGAGKGTRVGAILPSGADWVVSWLGASRIGALFMPFSSLYKPAELRRALRHGDVGILLGPATMFGRDRLDFYEDALPGLRDAGAEPLRLLDAPFLREVWLTGEGDRPWAQRADVDFRQDGGDHGVSDEFLEEVEREVTPADQMITIFTSGTTSEPKAVVYTHGAFLRHGANQVRFRDQGRSSSADPAVFCSFPFFWIGGLGPVNYSLVSGEKILCTERFDGDAILDLMEAEGSHQYAAWPPLVARLRQHIDTSGRDVSRIPAFTNPAPVGLRHASLGMTETIGPHSAPGPEAGRALPDELRDSFGLPIPHIELKVVDPVTRATVEDGVEGELCVRGYSLMDSLYKQERHTAFDDDGWFATGDKCLFRDGYVIFHGRIGEMIKTAGSNVAPREVEAVLQALPDIDLAMVAGVPDAELGEIVGAVIVPRAGAVVDAGEVLRAAARELSSYKVPRRVLVLAESEVLHLANGKLDRRSLADLLLDRGVAVAHDRSSDS